MCSVKVFGLVWNQLGRVDFIDFKWFHFDLKSMKSLRLKPSVLFETTSLGWFHWFQIELKSFEINEMSTSCDGLETAFHWFQMFSNRNEINEIDTGKWFQTEVKALIYRFHIFQIISIRFEINEIRFHWTPCTTPCRSRRGRRSLELDFIKFQEVSKLLEGLLGGV